jgi:hypothetical protein
LLLVLPAMLLAASGLNLAAMGGEAVSLQALADEVFYVGKDIERVLVQVWNENLLFDNEPNANATLTALADNYRTASGLVVEITPSWRLWTYGRPIDENLHVGTEYCQIARISSENWCYYFDMNVPGPAGVDWNEPILLVTKLDENLRITLVDYHYDHPDNWSNIYYGDTLLWENVIHEDPRIGDDNEVSGTTQLTVSIGVRDSRGIARYSSTVNLG